MRCVWHIMRSYIYAVCIIGSDCASKKKFVAMGTLDSLNESRGEYEPAGIFIFTGHFVISNSSFGLFLRMIVSH